MPAPLDSLTVIAEIGRQLAVVLLVGLVPAHVLPTANRRKAMARSLLLGLLFAALALLSLLLSVRFDEGIHMDARTGITAVAGAVGGLPAAVVTATAAAAYRLLLGGAIAWAAVGSIAGAAAAGALIYRWRGGYRQPLRVRELLLLAAIVAGQQAAWIIAAMPHATEAMAVILTSILPLDAAAVVVLGLIFAGQQRRDNDRLALRESQTRLQAAIDANRDAVFEVDYARGTDYYSPRFAQMLGYGSADVPAFDALIHPDDRDLEKQRARDHLAGRSDHYEAEFRLRHRDARWLWFLARGRVTRRGHDGQPLYWVGTISDITASKQAQQALAQSEARWRSLVENAQALIELLDSDGRVLFTNRSRAGFDGPVIGRPLWELLPDDVADEAQEKVRSVLDRGVTIGFESHDRLGRFHTCQVAPVRENGKIVAAVVITNDITDRKVAESQARDRLMQLARIARLNTIGQMAATFAHELNQPLTAIINYAAAASHHIGRLPNHAVTGSPLVDMMQRIIRQAHHASKLIDRARNYVARREPSSDSINLNDSVRQALDFIEAQARRVGAAVQADLQPSLPTVAADRDQIEQVLVNLLLNALDAMADLPGEDHCLRVSTSLDVQRRCVTVSVQDTGPGLSGDEVSRIFDPFMTTKGMGMGLGLPVSRSIITAMGGRLWAETRPVRGGFFAFTLPLPSVARPPSPPLANTLAP